MKLNKEKKQIKNLTYKKMKVAKLTNSDLINGGNILDDPKQLLI
jgi:hypothetical protein